MRSILTFAGVCFSLSVNAQKIDEKIGKAYAELMADSQTSHAIVALYVINNKTGEIVCDKNSNVGLPAASVQKIITASSAFEILSHNYVYNTYLAYEGTKEQGTLNGKLIIKGSGDPTLGSWRYKTTHENKILKNFKSAITLAGIRHINGDILASSDLWSTETIPPGWIWEDVGSYFGAGATALNWRENQYDLIMRSGTKIGEKVSFVSIVPKIAERFLHFKMEVTSAEKGSGDRSYIFIPSVDTLYHVTGTIPVNEDHFSISGSFIKPNQILKESLLAEFPNDFLTLKNRSEVDDIPRPLHIFYTHSSPPLDSICYWFLKRSINLYGEALIKTMAYEKTHTASIDSGINLIKNLWKSKGIDPAAINMKDGSGLSPSNRLTAAAIVSILKYDINQSWYESFLNALPVINGLKMKSGSIGDVLSYAGYAKNDRGDKFTFALIVNNYNGSADKMRIKMWKLLDNLK
ncbi:MAG: D-alanyl-D-alanine carboxypeptidase/D-alanyl-D-alanine-endopeptidase [Ginsengibacter sp.]